MANEQGKKPVVHTKKHIARLERERRQSRLILYIFIGILVTVIGLLGYGYLDLNYLQLRRPVATVGGKNILVREFESHMRLQRQQLLYQYNQMKYYQMFGMDVTSQIQQIETSLNDTQTMGQSVLDQLIQEEVIRQEAAKRGITVTDEELDRAIKESYQFFPDGTPTPTVTPTWKSFPTIPAQAFEIVTITPTPAPTPPVTKRPPLPLRPRQSIPLQRPELPPQQLQPRPHRPRPPPSNQHPPGTHLHARADRHTLHPRRLSGRI